jgi:hypothetical protein
MQKSCNFLFEFQFAHDTSRPVKTSLLPVSLALLLLASTRVCAQSDVIVSEDFESIPVGQIPQDFTKTGAIGVADDAAHSGHHSLRIEPAIKGGRFITLKGPKLAALGGQFWGRLYFKVKQPSPLPVVPEGKTSAAIHTTLVSGKTTSPLANDPIEVRLLGTITDMTGAGRYLYNVQPLKGRKEFGVTSKAKFHYTDEWTLAEWYVDNTTQTYQLFINGDEVKDVALSKGAGQFEGVELPTAFDTLSIGWTNYQAATGEGFTTWIDDLALGKKRLGPTGSASAAAK